MSVASKKLLLNLRRCFTRKRKFSQNASSQLFMNMPGGLKMPAIGIGTWQATDENQLEEALNIALDVGYRHIDTAFVYGNEPMIGRVLQQWFSSGKLKRKDIFITTKLPIVGVHQDRVEMFMKKSLENLQLDYVDLYLIHFPIGTKYIDGQSRPPFDDAVQTEISDHLAIWKKMEKQVDDGRTKLVGVSNFSIPQITRLIHSSRIKPACLQTELHVYLQQHDLVNFCHRNRMAVVAYCPLGSPGYNNIILYFGQEPKKLPDLLHDPVIENIARNHKKTNAQVMLRYLLQRNIATVPKSVTPERIKENIDVFNFSLGSEEMKMLGNLNIGEEARICDYKFFKGLSDHPEWPFPKLD